jgi:hypothetical protein
VAANPGNTVLTLASVNGAHPNDLLVIGSDAKTIQSVNVGAKQVTLTSGIAGTYAIGTFVQFPKGGAALNMALGQRIIWNSSITSNGRSGDPLGVFPTLYGNVQGDLIMESGNDGVSDYLSMRFAAGTTAAAPDTSRLRIRRTNMQFFSTAGIAATGFSFAGGDVGLNQSLNMLTNSLLSLGPGVWLTFDGTHIKGTVNAGGSYTVLV